jgi:tripartite-type tricarboxylate transporter receptor subunit TctC
MRFPRRRFLRLAAGSAMLPIATRIASAQAYPTRPVHLIVGFPAGSTGDVFARLTGQWLTERLGQPFVIENKPGAGTSIAAETVVSAKPDGHTLLWETGANATATTFNSNLKFDLIRDIAPVASVLRTFGTVVANPRFPAKTLPELIAYARANPGKIGVGIGGNGTLFHLAVELLKMMAGIDMLDVMYRGDSLVLTDLLGGQVQVAFVGSSAAIEQSKAGNLRVLAVSSASRWDGLPEVPAIAEFVPGYEAIGWQGLGAPRNTPGPIIDRLNAEINAGLEQANMKTRILAEGGTTLAQSPAAFGRLIAADTEKWAKIIRAANIRAE